MKKTITLVSTLLFCILVFSQTNSYTISFENAVHHEAEITASFSNIKSDTLAVRMSRTSPGRYALHEFAKNVYGFKATDSKGEVLEVIRPDPYSWLVIGHDGSVRITYTLFANRGDGTYSQIDETHAHLNIPATFMYAPTLAKRPIEVTFVLPKDLNWKVATQLPKKTATTYSAPNLQYFMDSPVEISDHGQRSFNVTSNGKTYTIQLVLHHQGTEEELDAYFEQVKQVVSQEKAVYGELPDFDYGTYTFLACYLPQVSGDGMEHRNSTVLTSTRSLAEGGMERNIGTVAHEFFHAWNVERIRPRSLEPFDFTAANMSGELWFAEGFTSYYTGLMLCRAGIISPEQYVEGLTRAFNYVWNSPARRFFNPIEMSYQAPFVDAAAAIDPVNRQNTFISYYSYGSVLGLALDLSLRQQKLHLDDYMKLVWKSYGKKETPYTLQDLQTSLHQYAGKAFADDFFNSYIYHSEMPDYAILFQTVGVLLEQHKDLPFFGATVAVNEEGDGELKANTQIGSPAHKAGLDRGDTITAINGEAIPDDPSFGDYIKQFKVGDTLKVSFKRFGMEKTTSVILEASPEYSISLMEKKDATPAPQIMENRKAWLKRD